MVSGKGGHDYRLNFLKALPGILYLGRLYLVGIDALTGRTYDDYRTGAGFRC